MTNIKKNCNIQSKALLSRPLVLHICCCTTDILSALVARYQSKLCYLARLFFIFVACATDILPALVARYQSKLCYLARLFSIFVANATDILPALVARNSKQALISHSLVLHICCLRNRYTICARCKKFKASFDFSLAC